MTRIQMPGPGRFAVTYLSYLILLAAAASTPIIATAGKIPVLQMKRVIGIVEVPAIFGVVDLHGPPGARLASVSHSVTVYVKPVTGSKVVAIVKSVGDIAIAEYGYEESGALVYDKRGGWYMIGIGSGAGSSRGWLRPADTGRYHSLTGLLKKGPSYLTRSWNLQLAPAPAAQAIRQNVKTRDIRVIDTRVIKQKTLLRIELLQPGACKSPSPKVVARGWIPAFAPNGHMNAWFYSRGC